MTDRDHLQRLCDLASDCDAWVALHAAAFDVDTRRIVAVLDGAAGTGTLPEGLAVRLVRSLGDPAAAERVVAGDGRAPVLDALNVLSARSGRHGMGPDALLMEVRVGLARAAAAAPSDADPSAVAAASATAVASALGYQARMRSTSSPVLRDVMVGLLDGSLAVYGVDVSLPPARLTVASKMLLTVAQAPVGSEAVKELVASIGSFDSLTASCVAATLAGWDTHTRRPARFAPRILADAVAVFAPYGPAEVEIGSRTGEQVAVQLGGWFLRSGGRVAGPGSLTEAHGVSDPSAVAPRLVAAAAATRDRDVMSEVISAVTHAGTVCCEVLNEVASCSERVDPAALVMALRPQLTAAGWSSMVQATVAVLGTDERAGRFLEVGLEHRPEFTAALLQQLPSTPLPFTSLPRGLVDTSMRVGGLAAWVDAYDEVASELLAVAEGVGADRWAVIVSLLGSFRGSPAELVEMSAELAPCAARAAVAQPAT